MLRTNLKTERGKEMKKYNVGIMGATGAVGQQMIKVLGEREFPVGELRCLASERSAGKTLSTPFGDVVIQKTWSGIRGQFLGIQTL